MEGMTEIRRDNYHAFLADEKEHHDIAGLFDKIEDDRGDKKEKAKEDIRNYAFSQMSEHLAEGERPESASVIDEPTAQHWAKLGIGKARERSANKLSKSLDVILYSEMPREHVGKIAREDEIIKRANAEEKEVLDAYKAWKGIEEFKSRFESSGKVNSDGEKDIVNNATLIGLTEKLSKDLKDKGYSSDIQNYAMDLAKEIVARGYVSGDKKKAYALPGLGKMIELQKQNYDTIAEKSGNVEDVGLGILERLAKGSRKEFDIARDVIYRTAN